MKPKNNTSLLRGIGWKIFHSEYPGSTADADIGISRHPRNSITATACDSTKTTGRISTAYRYAQPARTAKNRRSKNICAAFIAALLMVICFNEGFAQNFNNNGQIKNTGVIRIKNAMNGIPPAVNGTFELFGTNQILPATQYHHVLLSGTGTKSTAGGNLSVTGNLTITSPVILNITKGNVLTLGDTLFESGLLTGAIQKSVDLTGSTTSSNFGNIGAAISWSSNAPGITNVLRISDTVSTGNGNQSIKRLYKINSAVSDATGTIQLSFTDAELNGNDISTLQLWSSIDNGSNWYLEGGTVDTVSHTISQVNVTLNGLWTASDSTHPLGTSQLASKPAAMNRVSPDNLADTILTQIDSLTTLVVNAFGTPLKNVPVTFSISAAPVNAAGQQLSDTVVTTDSTGKARTSLTLGNKVGTYLVSATTATLPTITFTASARHGSAAAIALNNGNAQVKPILTLLDTVFTVNVTDIGVNPVEGATVNFVIASAPNGSSGQTLSVSSAQTDSLGRASTKLKLGNKVGTYKVNAAISGVSVPPIVFNATALPGAAASVTIALGNNQAAVNGLSLSDPFTVSVFDAGGNAVEGESIQFGISSVPDGANGQSLSDTIVTTDGFGQASTLLTLGNKTGDYSVVAQSSSLGGTLLFKARALAGAASVLNELAGNNQSAAINTPLTAEYAVRVMDKNGNAVPNASVVFAISSTPAGAAGAAISNANAVTDSNGSAATRLTLGSKVGSYSVTASVSGVPTITFNSIALHGAAVSSALVSGNNQTVPIITSVADEFMLRVQDAGGNNTPNVPVRFTVLSKPANAVMDVVRDTLVLSDTNGIARTSFQVGNKVGTYTIRASGSGIPDVDFTVRAIAGAPASIQAINGISQTKQILTPLDAPFVVRVTDIGGNNVPISTVRFAITAVPAGSTGASVQDSIVVSDSAGAAQTVLTLGTKVGTYEVTAFVRTVPINGSRSVKNPKGKTVTEASADSTLEIKFNATATHGAAAVFAQTVGDQQVKPTETKLDTAFAVTIHDIGGNIVPGAQVNFAISSAPVNAKGQQLSDTLVITDSAGTALTYLTLGDHEGVYTVLASVPAITPKLFAANAYFIYGDPNSDIDINVADITTIIDHAVAGKLLSYADSVKADLNHDGKVDTADVNILRDVILNTPLVFAEPVISDESAAPEKAMKAAAPLMKQTYFAGATTELAITPQGLRVNLNNSVPIRGIELRLRLKDTTAVDKINYLFSRAQGMTVAVKSSNRDITLLAYSLTNAEIASGNGSILRLPNITSLDQIDTSEVILSISSNIAVQSAVTTASASTSEYPATFELDQNYPNPFNGSTIIQYSIPDVRTTETKIAIHIFNILGQKVKTLVTGPHDPGTFKVTWDGTNDEGARVSSGVYFYRLIAKNFLTTKKMIYVK